LKARETEDISLVKRTPMALEIDWRDLPNRVCHDLLCIVPPLSNVLREGAPHRLSQRVAVTGRYFRRNSRTCFTAWGIKSLGSFQG
jgi:hypothetical protein